jgi:potassium efflux system protein
MAGQSAFIDKIMGYGDQALQIALGWLTSPAAWSQFAILGLAFLAARLLSKRLGPVLDRGIEALALRLGPLGKFVRPLKQLLPLLLPVLAYGLTAGGEQVTRAAFGSGEVIAFGKRVFLFLAARIFAREVLTDPFLKVLARYVLVPIAAL